MDLIIDGYNLLNAAGILPSGVGPGTLENARMGLLNFLAASLDPNQVDRTTVVFDSGQDAPRGLPPLVEHRGIKVHFASHYDDADALIEELIQINTAPRSLTVVSSDHRLQRAAKRRRARAVDSERWYAEVVRNRRHPPVKRADSVKPQPPQSAADIEYWLNAFQQDSDNVSSELRDSPFPPGYCEDLDVDDLKEDELNEDDGR